MKKEVTFSLLKKLISFQSVSADPKKNGEIKKAALFLRDQLKALGCAVHLLQKNNAPPCLIAVLNSSRRRAKTIGVYGHYDVQPEDPLDEWKSDPFTLSKRDGKFYARGVADTKGHLVQNIAAAAQALTNKTLNNNLVFIFEGEEESSGAHFERYAHEAKPYLSNVDAFLVTDLGMYDKGKPQVYYGLRGMVHFDLAVSIGQSDLHSGMWGNRVLNPIQVLCDLMANMKDVKTHHVRIPHIYDAVRQSSRGELESFITLKTKRTMQQEAAVWSITAPPNMPPHVASKIIPSMEIHGITGGYEGEGVKTIIPHKAHIKFSFRLVEHQNPKTIERFVSRFVKSHLPKGVKFTLHASGHTFPFFIDPQDPFLAHTAAILTEAFGYKTMLNRSGGTIPAAEILHRLYRKPMALTGFILPDSNIHAPNENIDEDMFWKGIEVLERIFASKWDA